MWSRVSKAADISKAVRIVIFPESMVSMISFVSLSKAVSVEHNDVVINPASTSSFLILAMMMRICSGTEPYLHSTTILYLFINFVEEQVITIMGNGIIERGSNNRT